VISFKPKEHKTFDGLKGVLYINNNGYAIQNVIAEPANSNTGGMYVKIQQKYEFIQNKQWFPVQLNSDFNFKQISLKNICLTGEGRTYIKDIKLNPELSKKDFSNVEIEAELPTQAKEKDIWNLLRKDSLTEKERRTYKIIDSIGNIAKLDRTLRTFERLTTGKIPLGYIDIDMNRLIRINGYEGLRMGIGIHNNYRTSKHVLIGGYVAYGFKDEGFKYGGDLSYKFSKRHDASIGIKYCKDVAESGEISFYENTGFLSDAYLRRYMVKIWITLRKKKFLQNSLFLNI